jgi:hypothetical protein
MVALNITLLALLVALAIWRFRQLIAGLGQSIVESGEEIVIGPERGLYVRAAWIASLKTEGAIALTDQRLVFRKPIGGDISLPLADIEFMSLKKWYRGEYRGGRQWLILKLADGSEVAFMVRDPELWTQRMLEWEDAQPK